MALSREHLLRVAVRNRVQKEMAERDWNIRDLAREADLDPGTVGDFINGPRWPQYSTRSKISRALGWTPNGIDQYVDGGEIELADVENVRPASDDAGVLASLPPEALEGLDEVAKAEVAAAARLSALQTAREIRRRLDS